jgi:hypothetical protein
MLALSCAVGLNSLSGIDTNIQICRDNAGCGNGRAKFPEGIGITTCSRPGGAISISKIGNEENNRALIKTVEHVHPKLHRD